MEKSVEYQQHEIKHMMDIVQMRIQQETKKLIEMKIPETDEEMNKLREMYKRALSKYDK